MLAVDAHSALNHDVPQLCLFAAADPGAKQQIVAMASAAVAGVLTLGVSRSQTRRAVLLATTNQDTVVDVRIANGSRSAAVSSHAAAVAGVVSCMTVGAAPAAQLPSTNPQATHQSAPALDLLHLPMQHAVQHDFVVCMVHSSPE